jgi:putative sterol carrier protein
VGYVKDIIDRLLRLQDRFYPEVAEYYKIGEGKVSLLRVVGVDGESVLLKCEGGRLKYADGDERPIHIFRMSTDTFLSLISGEEDLREAMTKGHFIIEDASTGAVDLVELERWAKAFSRLRSLVTRLLKI